LQITDVAALLAGSVPVVLAAVDGDGNLVPGIQSGVFARQMPSGIDSSYATAIRPRRWGLERDGDANPVPGAE
jgi:hypothetical protein